MHGFGLKSMHNIHIPICIALMYVASYVRIDDHTSSLLDNNAKNTYVRSDVYTDTYTSSYTLYNHDNMKNNNYI